MSQLVEQAKEKGEEISPKLLIYIFFNYLPLKFYQFFFYLYPKIYMNFILFCPFEYLINLPL